MHDTCAVLYCYLLTIWLYHIFPHYLIKETNFGEEISKNFVLIFPTSWHVKFLILRQIQRDIVVNVQYFGLHGMYR
jgi:hypothetical protein